MEGKLMSSGRGVGGRDLEALEQEAESRIEFSRRSSRWKLTRCNRRSNLPLPAGKLGWLRKNPRKIRPKGRSDMNTAEGTPIEGVRQSKSKPPVKPKPPGKTPRDPWTDVETECLITVFSKKYLANNKDNFTPKYWIDVSVQFNDWARASGFKVKEQQQIHDKTENLKKKYRKEKDREQKTGGTPSTWKWFKLLNTILGDDPKHSGVANGMDAGVPVSGSYQDSKDNEDDDNEDNSNLATSMLQDEADSSPTTEQPTQDQSIPDSQQPTQTMGERQQPTVVIAIDDDELPSTSTPGVKAKPVTGRKCARQQSQSEGSDLANTMREFAGVFAQVSREQMQENAKTQKETSKIQLEMIKLIMGYKGTDDTGPSSS